MMIYLRLYQFYFVYLHRNFSAMEILFGILCGLVLSLFFSVGPSFFALIQNSIHYGFRKGVAFEVGVNSSDILIVGLMLTLLKNVDMSGVLHNSYVASIGGSVVIVLGIVSLLRKPVKREGKKLVFEGVPRGRELALQGFALNFLNPTVWIYWISIITFISGELELSLADRYIFFVSLLLTELAVGILKCRLSSLLQNIFSARMMNWVNKGVGIVLIGIGAYLIISMLVHQKHPELPERDSSENATQLIQRIHGMAKDSAKNADTLYLK